MFIKIIRLPEINILSSSIIWRAIKKINIILPENLHHIHNYHHKNTNAFLGSPKEKKPKRITPQ
jgi:hypothetical protein